jgi:2,4-dienoyl-CoA reductase-like NADH-dependent reductase (Old Yellow Enzyme family)/thioredoxin reductase
MKVSKILSKGKIGSLELENRFIFPAIDTSYAHRDGKVSETTIKHYERIASGGAGLITVEAATVHKSGLIPKGLDLSTDSAIQGFSKIAEAIKRQGTKAAAQLFHPGRQTSSRHTGHTLFAPSAIPSKPVYEIPEEMTKALIFEMIGCFAQAALRVKLAGFDAVEFHGAHGYLINGFLSPWSNKREDEFGGTIENRCKFAVEIIKKTRELVGEDFPILFRISGHEYVFKGYDIEEAKAIALRLEEAGVDALHISAGNYESFEMMFPPMNTSTGTHQDLAKEIKKIVKIPIISVGRIHTPEIAEQILVEGKADFVAVGRGMLADPDFVKKIKSNQEELIRPCISCNICVDKLYGGEGVQCIQNPELGYKFSTDILQAPLKKKMIIVGAGPAGMQAAITAAERGHDVSLYEQSDDLGGTVRLAATPFFKKGYWNFISSLKKRAENAGVKIHLNTKVDHVFIRKEAPDTVILATGSTFRIPAIKGIDLNHVKMAEDIIKNPELAGNEVVIIGGGWTGCEVSIVLAQSGRKATVVKRGSILGDGIGRSHRWSLLKEMEERGVQNMTNVSYEEISKEGLVVLLNGERKLLKADTIVIAAGLESNNNLYSILKNEIEELYLIGDAIKTRTVLEAVQEATKLTVGI